MRELIQIENVDLARNRLSFLENLPLLAWFKVDEAEVFIGDITDIAAAEAISCCEGISDPKLVARNAKRILLKLGHGRQLVGNHPDSWMMLRSHIIQRAEWERAIPVVSRFNGPHSKMTIKTLLQGELAKPDEISRRLEAVQAQIEAQIRDRGDRRIRDPNAIAKAFRDSVYEMVENPKSVKSLIESIYLNAGLLPEEINENQTFEYIDELAKFRTKLRVIAPKSGYDFEYLRTKVRMDCCPHWIIPRELTVHTPLLSEIRGSDLSDGYHAVLAAYVDFLLVDKRVAESFRRLSQNKKIQRIINRVSKASDFTKITDQLPQ